MPIKSSTSPKDLRAAGIRIRDAMSGLKTRVDVAVGSEHADDYDMAMFYLGQLRTALAARRALLDPRPPREDLDP